MHITILGGGSWGTALAIHLAKKQHQVNVWEFFKEQAEEMQKQRVCRLLPEVTLPENIFISSQLELSLAKSELVIIAVPSDKVERTVTAAKPFCSSQPIILASKGFAQDGQLLSEVVQEQLANPLYCLYGPTHAEEVCKGLFSGMVLAGGKGKLKLKKAIESNELKVELSNDIIGVQVAAALKNVIAVLGGMIEGKGLGDNARAYVMTKGLQEIQQLGLKMGAKKETFYGLAGVGDLIVTCGSRHSRNFHVGREVGKGRKLDAVLSEMKMVAEGVTTTKHIPKLCQKFTVTLPLLQGVYEVLYQGKDLFTILEAL